MQQSELKPGDLVRLRAGGPVMSAETVRYGYARCAWFDPRQAPHWRNFMITALERLEPEETRPDTPG